MSTFRFLVGATLLLGACDTLWAPFQGANSAFCDPDLPACNNARDGGNSDGAVGDAGVGDAGVGDAGVGDAAGTTPDLLCNPGTSSAWTLDLVPPGAGTTALSGITGNGSSDLWTVGNPTYAAHRGSTGWAMISLGINVSTLSHVAYAHNQGQALALGTGVLVKQVLHLNQTTLGAVDSLSGLAATMTGIWVSATPEYLPYVTAADGTFKSYSGGNWNDVGATAPSQLVAITGSGMAGTTAILGVTAAADLLAAYPVTAAWGTTSTNNNSFNSAWVSPTNNSVVLVGKNGLIMTAPSAASPIGVLTSVTSPATQTLNEVSGTSDGKHLWAVGESGTIVHWEAMCGTWTKETSPVFQDLNALWVGPAEVWAVGANGTVLHRAIP